MVTQLPRPSITRLMIGLLLTGIMLMLAACTIDPDAAAFSAEEIYCTEMGFTYDLQVSVEGEATGTCVFPDGSQCPARDFFVGICQSERSMCARNGYQLRTIRDQNQAPQYAVCDFLDGSRCMEFDFAINGDKCLQSRLINFCVELPGGICREYHTE